LKKEILKRRTNYRDSLGEQESFMTPLLQKAISEALKTIPEPANGAYALDIGAGECPLRPTIEKMGYSYKSLDIEQNSANNIDFVSRIDVELPRDLLRGASCDLLLLTEVLEHVPDWEVAFRNLATLLKTGGYCIISSPFFYMLHEEPYDFWRPTNHAIRFYAERHGLEVVHSMRYGNVWDVMGTLFCSTSICRREKNWRGILATLPIYLFHYAAKIFLKHFAPRNLVEIQGRFYMGNFFLLRKGFR
jgi:SAM-dependent methyltransferase